jgi:hypothetical protein
MECRSECHRGRLKCVNGVAATCRGSYISADHDIRADGICGEVKEIFRETSWQGGTLRSRRIYHRMSEA